MYTDKLFTGQRNIAGLGIYHYQSRFYSPKLGRFLSADSLVPNPFNPQDYNRYSYVRNNPVRYTDPSGHMCSDPEDPTPTCDNSFLSTTKVGNKVVKGSGLDAGKPTSKAVKPKKGNGGGGGDPLGGASGGTGGEPNLPPVTNTPTPTVTITGTSTDIPTPTVTTTPTIPTVTRTPTIIPTRTITTTPPTPTVTLTVTQTPTSWPSITPTITPTTTKTLIPLGGLDDCFYEDGDCENEIKKNAENDVKNLPFMPRPGPLPGRGPFNK
ncbi:MAG: hypothetical protein CNIPEHKO_02211 [Anaerolineales bacterium]|nr:hypothetical protein [Anaerolineales bacterium]